MKLFFHCILLFLVIILLAHCGKTRHLARRDIKDIPPVSQQMFIESPFGFDPTIKNFRKKVIPPYRETAYTMKNKHNPNLVDTIFRFYYKKSELFVYKTHEGRNLFFAGNIYDNKISLSNGIYVGMQRGAFFNSFTNLRYNTNDTVVISSEQRISKCKFIFRNDKLTGIKIENYID